MTIVTVPSSNVFTTALVVVLLLAHHPVSSHPVSSVSVSSSSSSSANSASASSSFLAAAPGPDVVDGFWSSPTVSRDLERFTRTCRPLMGQRLDRWLELYDTHTRVLTVEAACLTDGQNGLGNILGDFLAWFVWGIITDRAVYIRWTDCPDDDDDDDVENSSSPSTGGGRRNNDTAGGGWGGGRARGEGGAGGRGGAAKCPADREGGGDKVKGPVPCRARANLGQYFQMPGGRDWGLTPAVWRRLARAHGGASGGPTTSVSVPGDFPDGPDGLFGGSISGGSGGGGDDSGGDGGGSGAGDGSDGGGSGRGGGSSGGGVLGGDDAWVEVKITSGHGLVPHPVGSDSDPEAQRAWSEAVVGLGYRHLARATQTDVSSRENDMVDFALVEGIFDVHLRGCVFHAAARPTPRLQRALKPYLRRFDRGLALVALHLRTKFVDDVGDEGTEDDESWTTGGRGSRGGVPKPPLDVVAKEVYDRAKRTLAESPGNFSLGLIRRGDPERRWNELNRMLAAGGFTRRNDDELMRRCPHIRPDGGGDEALFSVGGPDAAGLSPYLTCAGRAAQLAATERAGEINIGSGVSGSSSPPRWSLYVATDAPYIKRLTAIVPSLRGKMVGCQGRCVFRHTSHGLAPTTTTTTTTTAAGGGGGGGRGGGGGGGGDGGDRFLQSFVDGYIIGLADHCLPITASTFPQLAHRGFGVTGVAAAGVGVDGDSVPGESSPPPPPSRPQMLDRDWDGFKLQGGGEPWSNKHLPLCEAAGIEEGGAGGEEEQRRCRDVYAAVLGRGTAPHGGGGAWRARGGRRRREGGGGGGGGGGRGEGAERRDVAVE